MAKKEEKPKVEKKVEVKTETKTNSLGEPFVKEG